MTTKESQGQHDGHAFSIEKYNDWNIICVTCNSMVMPLPNYSEKEAEQACDEFVKTFKGSYVPH